MDKFFNVLVLSLLALLFATLVGLGFWQLDRAEQKRELLRQYAAVSAQPPLAISAFETLPPYTPVRLRGRWADGPSVWLQNRFNSGRVGVEHYRLFQPQSGAALLVNLGWMPRRPSADSTIGGYEVEGLLAPPPAVGLQLGSVAPPAVAGEDLETPYLDLAAIGNILGQQLAPVVVLARGDSEAYVRNWQPTVADPNRNIGYAVQWFALAATLVIAVALFIRRQRGRR